jgi:hypothetical protein
MKFFAAGTAPTTNNSANCSSTPTFQWGARAAVFAENEMIAVFKVRLSFTIVEVASSTPAEIPTGNDRRHFKAHIQTLGLNKA